MSRPLMVCMLLTAPRASEMSFWSCLMARLAPSRRALLSSTSPERAADLRSEMPTCSTIWALERASSSKAWMVSRSWVWYLLMDFRPSELALFAWSRPISSSLISPSSCFLMRRASPLALCSASMEAPRDSMARAWFFLVMLNSSSVLGHTPVNLLPDIGKLKLGAEDSVLLHLKSGLSLLKSLLQLLLLLLKHASLFVQSMDGAATL